MLTIEKEDGREAPWKPGDIYVKVYFFGKSPEWQITKS